MGFGLGTGEQHLGDWTIDYTPPEGGRHTRRPAVGGSRRYLEVAGPAIATVDMKCEMLSVAELAELAEATELRRRPLGNPPVSRPHRSKSPGIGRPSPGIVRARR